MRLNVKVIPRAKRELFKKEGELIKIYLTVPPVNGKANAALVRFLAEHFGVRPSDIEIIKGLHSQRKTIIINGI